MIEVSDRVRQFPDHVSRQSKDPQVAALRDAFRDHGQLVVTKIQMSEAGKAMQGHLGQSTRGEDEGSKSVVASQFDRANLRPTKIQYFRKGLGLVSLEVLHVDVAQGVDDEGTRDWNVEDRVEEDGKVLRLLFVTD